MRNDIQQAVELLRRGELVAFPTETVYGLGADAMNADAVSRIFAAKERPADHPVIVHLALDADLSRWAREIPPAAEKLAMAFWPGPLTMILRRQRRVPDIVTGGQDTVGLRVPDHPIARELLARFAGGIAAPSANRHGRISPTTAEHVKLELGTRVPMILDGGPCSVGIESTIVDLSIAGSVRVLRPGAIRAADIADTIGRPLADDDIGEEGIPRVSGSLPGHYAPRTPMLLIPADQLAEEVARRRGQGLHVAVLGREVEPKKRPDRDLQWQRALHGPAAYAHDLYAHLRALDAAEVDLILVERPPETDAWAAVNDRLTRAAYGSGADEDT